MIKIRQRVRLTISAKVDRSPGGRGIHDAKLSIWGSHINVGIVLAGVMDRNEQVRSLVSNAVARCARLHPEWWDALRIQTEVELSHEQLNGNDYE